jgi:hypothetical protein
MSRQQHPDAEALARYQAGDVGGIHGRRLAAHVAGCARCASVTDDLTAVSTLLASVPAPSMPDAVERQITAAIAAEAATRQAASPAAADSSAPDGQRSRHLRPVRPDRSHTRGFRPALVAVSAAACLLLVGFGYLLSQTGSSSSSSSAASVAAPAVGAAPAVSASAAHAANGHAAASAVPKSAGKAVSPTRGAQQPLESQPAAPFLVTKSGTSYQPATLAAQVRGELNRGSTPSAAAGTYSAAGSTGGSPPSQSLIGCVLTVTGNVPPTLVDVATYEGKPAYVIAVSSQAWVVGPDCSASNTDVIASVALPA